MEECEDGQDDNTSVSSSDNDDDIVLCDTNMPDDQKSTDNSEDNAENLFTRV